VSLELFPSLACSQIFVIHSNHLLFHLSLFLANFFSLSLFQRLRSPRLLNIHLVSANSEDYSSRKYHQHFLQNSSM
jgi:hypothetical protein